VFDPARCAKLQGMTQPGKLCLFCGKMAAGKSTLARRLAAREAAVLLVQDELLATLYPDEIVDVAGYVKYSRRVNQAMHGPICALLAAGRSVVMDFPGNTRAQRAWFRTLIDATGAAHELHFVDVSDEVCKQQLRQRSAGRAAGDAFTSDAEFDAITKYFEPPAADEGFAVILHRG
jgi:predicted kinase